MHRSVSGCHYTDVGIAGNVDLHGGARIAGRVLAENYREMEALGIRHRAGQGHGDGTKHVATAYPSH
jgi:hypothetical protein